MVYRQPTDALRARYLELVSARDELDARIDAGAGSAGAVDLGALHQRRDAIVAEISDVSSRIDERTRSPAAARTFMRQRSRSFARDALLAAAIAGVVGLGIASFFDTPPPKPQRIVGCQIYT